MKMPRRASLNADLYDPAQQQFLLGWSQCLSLVCITRSRCCCRMRRCGWRAAIPIARELRIAHGDLQAGVPVHRGWERHVVAATRPTIARRPANITWGGAFTVSTPDAANISQAVLVRPGSSTHAFDMDQRLVGMSFTAGSGTLTVTAPPNGKIAPPGYYMLFLMNSNGVPSVASFVC